MGKGYSDNYQDWAVSITPAGKLVVDFCGSEWVPWTPVIKEWYGVNTSSVNDQK